MAGSIKELAVYRLDCADGDLESAKELYQSGKYRQSMNRSYYAIFHAMRSINALDEFDSRKHSGVIAHFNRCFVKTGEFPREMSRIIREASDMRESADYEDFFIASREEAAEQIEHAEKFLTYIREYLKEKNIFD